MLKQEKAGKYTRRMRHLARLAILHPEWTATRLSPIGVFTNLHSFTDNDGSSPWSGVIQGTDGNFYGTANNGGVSNCGTVFRITPSGSFTNLHGFSGGSDGCAPLGWLTLGSDGNFYGTTQNGGVMNVGTVFKMSPSGSVTSLYSFANGSDGDYPLSGLVQGSDGNFYGTTFDYGTKGTVFRITPSGDFTNLHSFGGSEGLNPWCGVVQGSDGNIYGTTFYGGTNDHGTVFTLSVPMSPPANQISEIQLVGSDVVISIPSVAGETYQLQFSPDLSPDSWSNVSGAVVSNSIGAMLTLTNFGGASWPQGFYRFAITP
ncbi:MAG TPA: choice-of-anchor tandem repeat GloVer-containing protein [Verrucomicrobiae bacterium]|nr:choice-of-anchor tandem repeat GloVer-containing protein [Verrucomicrobiae bacterium]